MPLGMFGTAADTAPLRALSSDEAHGGMVGLGKVTTLDAAPAPAAALRVLAVLVTLAVEAVGLIDLDAGVDVAGAM